jgi:hypothetical protein
MKVDLVWIVLYNITDRDQHTMSKLCNGVIIVLSSFFWKLFLLKNLKFSR